MYTFSPMMVANSRKHHCRVRSYTREVLVISTNLDIQKNHYPLDFRNRRGDEARIKNTKDILNPLNFQLRFYVGIKSLLDAVWITGAHVFVNAAQMDLVLLMNFKENMLITTASTKLLLLDKLMLLRLEVIENGVTLPKTTTVEGVVIVMPITTAKENAQRRLEVKARSTLMMGILNEHMLKFNSIKDAKKLLEAVEKRFGGNAATKKTQRNLLKKQYENFTTPSLEMLDQTFYRLQKLMSPLELLDEKLSQEDVNQKLLRSFSIEWNTHAVMCRNKADLDTMSMDDLYNNLKVYEPEVKGMSSSSSSTQNMAFVSSSNNNTSSTKGAVNTAPVNTAHGVSTVSTQVNAANSKNINNLSDAVICAFFASKPNSPHLVHEDLQQIHPDDMEEMDQTWQMAMLTMRERRAPRNQDNKNKESSRRSVVVETSTSTALVSCDGLGGYDWSDQAEEGPNYALMAFSSSSPDSEVSNDSICSKSCLETVELLKSQNDQLLKDLKKSKLMVLAYKIGLGYENYNAVPPPYIGNFMPPTPDLSFTGLDEFVNEPVVENYKPMSSGEEPKIVKKNDDALIIEEWVSNDEEEDNLLPRAVLMKFGLLLVSTAGQVNVAHSKTTVNAARPMSYLSKIAYSIVKRPIHKNTTFKNSNINQRVNTVRDKNYNIARPKAVVNAVNGNNFDDVKASACWVWKPKHKGNPQIDLQDQGVIDSRCSRYMTENMSYLTDYEEIDGGYVAFGGNPKEGTHAKDRENFLRRGYIKTCSGPDWLFDIDDDIQAKIDADHQLVEILKAQEQEELSDAEKDTLFQQLLEKRRKHFAAKRA
ncbi:hypothetical protein Tco_0937048 [Tanacetum coccineum]|uniref:Uncharacterized protein n=1 Tax=Tanacetum coccineum TaxID=301880 RepID=A0ABQ5DFW4_9ASTR